MSSVQYIKSDREGKPITWYVYAFKGGPLVLKHIGPKKPRLTADQWRFVAEAQERRNAAPKGILRALIRRYRSDHPNRASSPEWEALAPGTKELWGRELDRIEMRWGEHPITIWNEPRMVAKVVKWRDERASTPRAADVGITALKALLEFGRLRGDVSINVASKIPKLYKGGNRADIIWTDEEISRFQLVAEARNRRHVFDGLRLAALTGLRRADLVSLVWDEIGDVAIVKTALKKSRGKRRRVVVPMTEQLASLLEELKTRPRNAGVETVLVNARGLSWTEGGFTGSFNAIRDEAEIVHIDEDGERKMKHLHDVRGTFCTYLLVECELTDAQAAEIMAWSPERVGNIRKVYVDQSRVVVALGERISAKQRAKQSSND